MKRIHLCYLCDEYPPSHHGGVGSFVQTISRKLTKESHLVSVVGFYDIKKRQEWFDMGVRVIQLPCSKIPYIKILIQRIVLARELRLLNSREQIDLIESPELGLAFLPKLPKVSYIIRLHGGHHFFSIELGSKPKMGRSWFEKMSFRNADYICSVSRYVAESTRNILNIKLPIEVIPNPVDVELFLPTKNEEDKDLIVFVGTICEKKGIRQLVQAMPLILETNPTARLLVIGRDLYVKKLKKSYLEYLTENTKTEVLSHISFFGEVKHHDLPALLSKASVCVYPSHMEAMPIAWLEGLSMGKAVIASSVGPGPEIIEDGVDGLLCNPHDPISIAEKVIIVLRDEKFRKKLGKNAREKAKVEYSVDVLAKKNIEYYERCLQNP